MLWDRDPLLAKAKVFIQRAFETERRDSPLFPLWATIGLEFVGRAALSSVNPCLLADPQVPEAILYACGLAKADKAKSVQAKTVFARCRIIVEDFTDADVATCMVLMNRRNEELHTAKAAFDDLKTGEWLADYYRVLEKLLKHLKHDLSFVLGTEDCKAAAQMISAAAKALLGAVNKKVADHKVVYGTLEPGDVADRRAAFKLKKHAFTGPQKEKDSKCPACGEDCLISGEVIRSTDPKLAGDDLFWESIILPNHLRCGVCGLELRGHDALHIAGQGGQFSLLRWRNAADYYLEGIDPHSFSEAEYNNS